MEQLNIYVPSNPYLTLYTKISFYWITDLHIKAKTIKPLDKNIKSL